MKRLSVTQVALYLDQDGDDKVEDANTAQYEDKVRLFASRFESV